MKRGRSRKAMGIVAAVEALESRWLLSAYHHHYHYTPSPTPPPPPSPALINSPLTITQNGSTLQLIGTSGDDQIRITQSGSTFTIYNGTWSTSVIGSFGKLVVKGNGGNDSITVDPSVTIAASLYGGSGSDTLVGNNAGDSFFAGTGTDVMQGGTGNDTFVTIGSRGDTITGGLGSDSFWMDGSSSEIITDLSSAESASGHVHRVTSFLGGVSTTLAGQRLTDPAVTDSSMVYRNFSTLPLFGNIGPSEDDINQGYIGDCWYLSSLSSVAKVSPDRIRQCVVDLGDGTYAVQFGRPGQTSFVRVDGDLPTWYGGNQLAYAGLGNGSSLWVAIMEKAMTKYWGAGTTYNDIDGGWMSSAYASMGLACNDLWGSSASDLFNQISAALSAGKAVTYAVATPPAGAPLIGDHAYTVDHVGHDAHGNPTITLRNPWGVDGAGNDGTDDGYVTVTPAQLFAACMGACAATV